MIAIDAMGGDFAPQEILAGALQSSVPVCLFGPEDLLVSQLDLLDPMWRDKDIKIVDAPQIIEMGEEPVQAFRRKRHSSLVEAISSVQDGTCSAVISAGNSGAVMAASLFLIGRNDGVDRPALVGTIPGVDGPVVCLDLGANADCKPKNMFQFGELGSRYAKDFLNIESPKIGLLSVGEERTKGSMLTKEVFCLLEELPGFVGNVEPRDVLKNKIDVLVTDGFSGNVLLKTFEATVSFCSSRYQVEEERTSMGDGGALLLGIKRPVIIAHGSARAKDIVRAIKFADKVTQLVDVKKYSL